MLEWERRQVAGLPAYVAEGPGPAAAALVFRAGQADEPLPRRGLTHLVEHLVLGSVDRSAGINGQVDLLSTQLTVERGPAEVAARMHAIAAALGSPPVGRLEVERRVLEVEARRGVATGATVLLQLFYGARGPGVAAFEELGLRDVGAADVVEHARTWFCHGNAALVLVGPVDGLEGLALPPGPRRPAPAPAARMYERLPAEVSQPGSPLALGAPLPAVPAVVVLAEVLERRAWAALREARGLAYDVDCRARAVGAGERLLMLTTDVPEQDAGAAAEALVEEVGRLATGELDEREVEVAVSALEHHASRAEPLGLLSAAAASELLVGRPRLPADLVGGLRAVTRDAIVEHAVQLAGRMLLACPAGTSSGSLPPVEAYDTVPVTGRRHRRRHLSRSLDPKDVIVGGDGVTQVVDDATSLTVRYATCAAAVREYGGGLTLIGESGTTVTVDPGDIRDGDEAVARIQRALAPGLLVAADERVRRVEAAASRPLRPVLVGEAGEVLAPLLGRGEQLVLTAEATRGVRSGILAVTDRRLLFVSKLLAEYVEEIALSDVQRVATRRNPAWPAVVVELPGTRVRIGFLTVGRALDAARAVRQALVRRGA